ncbi:MAG: hypothetical protein ABIJ56_08160 [Pseudomonadota bacterium]
MPGIIGYMGKDPVFLRCAYSLEQEAIRESADKFGGWGIIFYQAGDILLRSHPTPTRDAEGLMKVLRDADATALLGRFESPTAPPPGKWNMQPFRYRGWVYAQEGRIAGFARVKESLVAAMPDFLGRSLKGSSDAEVIFHLILSFLYDAGKLDSAQLDPMSIQTAMKHSLQFTGRMCAEFGCRPPAVSQLISNGIIMAGYCAGQSGGIAVYEGRGKCDDCGHRKQCKLYRQSESSRATLVMIMRRFPEAFRKKHFSAIQADTFFFVTPDITVEMIPGRISSY